MAQSFLWSDKYVDVNGGIMSDKETAWSDRAFNRYTERLYPSHDCGKPGCEACHEIYHAPECDMGEIRKWAKEGCYLCQERRKNFLTKEWRSSHPIK